MNTALLFWVLSLACCCLVTLGREVARTPTLEERSSVTSSGTDIQSSADEDNELEQNDIAEIPLAVQHLVKKEGRHRRKGKGKKRHKGTSHGRSIGTSSVSPSHTLSHTSSHTSTHMPSHDPSHSTGHTPTQTEGEDLCLTTHQHYCIHGHCKYMADLHEPTCVCMMGYDGERCGIQLMKTEQKKADEEVVQTVLVVIAVVLSLISCCAILLMICAHYRTHKNFLAAYLGPNSEKEKLQADGNGAEA